MKVPVSGDKVDGGEDVDGESRQMRYSVLASVVHGISGLRAKKPLCGGF